MHSQLTEQDYADYGSDFINMTRRAAVDAVGPELQRLQAENRHLQQMAQRSNTATIQAALDREVPDWHSIYQNEAFAEWLSEQDPYSTATRSQLLRDAVIKGDGGRVVRIYRGFEREAHHAPAYHSRSQSGSTASGGNSATDRGLLQATPSRRHP
jgi:hypothetical protein